MLCVLVAVALAAAFSPYSAVAGPGRQQIPNKPPLGSLGARLNADKIALITGNPNATYLSVIYYLSVVLDNSDNFRRQSGTVRSIPGGAQWGRRS